VSTVLVKRKREEREMSPPSPPSEPSPPDYLFAITVRDDPAGRVIMIGKPSRKRADVLLNVPLCPTTKEQLEERLEGSLAMGTSALIEWALTELTRQGITLEAQAKS
jgi:hypothetical protein